MGFQADSAQELVEKKAAAQHPDMTMLDEGETTCCYARSDKHWITDPQGVAWEQFHALGEIPVFNEASQTVSGAACCAPAKPTAAACRAPRCSRELLWPRYLPQVILLMNEHHDR